MARFIGGTPVPQTGSDDACHAKLIGAILSRSGSVGVIHMRLLKCRTENPSEELCGERGANRF